MTLPATFLLAVHGGLAISGGAVAWIGLLFYRHARHSTERFGAAFFVLAGLLALFTHALSLFIAEGRGHLILEVGNGIFGLATAVAILLYVGALSNRDARSHLENQEQTLRPVEPSHRTDATTGLYTHRVFQRQLEEEIARSRRYNRSLSLFMIDIDHFKTLNDTYGYPAGDAILKEVSEVIRKGLRTIDSPARYGGEEFAVILPETSLEGARIVAERLRNNILYHVFTLPHGHRAFISVSIGVANFPIDGRDKEGLTKAVHRALYFAKENGRNRIGLHSEVLMSGIEKDPTRLEDVMLDSKLGMMRNIGLAIDSKTPYTQGHTDKVVRLAMKFAKVLQLGPEESESLRVASLLHNIGLINASENILNKPGPLTLEERKIIQAHPTLAEMLLKDAPHLDGVLPAILYHHERWDGNGYPKGLREEEIPYLARVLAIAESYQAMVSERPYRRKMSEGEAIDELRRNAGTQFDPQMVNLLWGILEKKV
jgi:diguanylate cyclase (GGDEF)-like protein